MRLLIILSPLLLMACAPVEHPPSPIAPPAPAQVKDCAELSFYHVLSALSVEEQQQALISLRQETAGTAEPRGKIRLALLLSQGDSEIRDGDEAKGLLDSLLDRPADISEQEQALVILLLEIIELRKQAEDNLMKVHELRSRLKKADKDSKGYQNQLKELKSQLQQLQSLEKVIDQQEQAINPPRIGHDGTE